MRCIIFDRISTTSRCIMNSCDKSQQLRFISVEFSICYPRYVMYYEPKHTATTSINGVQIVTEQWLWPGFIFVSSWGLRFSKNKQSTSVCRDAKWMYDEEYFPLKLFLLLYLLFLSAPRRTSFVFHFIKNRKWKWNSFEHMGYSIMKCWHERWEYHFHIITQFGNHTF
jgi:hypothetical protein